MSDTARLYSLIGLKAKSPGERKPFKETKIGDSFFRLTGVWHKLVRVIDRRNNHYYEHITDLTTRRVIRHVEEPLTDHQGRGDAKRKRRADDGAD